MFTDLQFIHNYKFKIYYVFKILIVTVSFISMFTDKSFQNICLLSLFLIAVLLYALSKSMLYLITIVDIGLILNSVVLYQSLPYNYHFNLLCDYVKILAVIAYEQSYFEFSANTLRVIIVILALASPFKVAFVQFVQVLLFVCFNIYEPNNVEYQKDENGQYVYIYYRHAWLILIGFSYNYIILLILYTVYVYLNKEVVNDDNVTKLTDVKVEHVPDTLNVGNRVAIYKNVDENSEVYELS